MGLRDNFRQAARELMGTEAEAPAREPAEDPEDGSQEERDGFRTEEPADEGGAPTEPPIELPPAPERTYIAVGAHIEGNVTAEGGVELDGSIKGSLTSRSALLVRGVLDGDGAGDRIRVLGGRVNGNLKAAGAMSVDSASVIIGDIGAQSLELDGKVKGDLSVEQELTLGEHAVVWGDITAGTAEVRSGAVFQGQVRVQERSEEIADLFRED